MDSVKDWSPKPASKAITRKNFNELKDYLGAAFEYYKGWHFELQHPDIFTYRRMSGEYVVAFTPDWDRDGVVQIDVQTEGGDTLNDGENVPHTGVLSPTEIFRMIKPYLDKYGD